MNRDFSGADLCAVIDGCDRLSQRMPSLSAAAMCLFFLSAAALLLCQLYERRLVLLCTALIAVTDMYFYIRLGAAEWPAALSAYASCSGMAYAGLTLTLGSELHRYYPRLRGWMQAGTALLMVCFTAVTWLQCAGTQNCFPEYVPGNF